MGALEAAHGRRRRAAIDTVDGHAGEHPLEGLDRTAAGAGGEDLGLDLAELGRRLHGGSLGRGRGLGLVQLGVLVRRLGLGLGAVLLVVEAGERLPHVLGDEPVDPQLLGLLELAHGPVGRRPELPVHGDLQLPLEGLDSLTARAETHRGLHVRGERTPLVVTAGGDLAEKDHPVPRRRVEDPGRLDAVPLLPGDEGTLRRRAEGTVGGDPEDLLREDDVRARGPLPERGVGLRRRHGHGGPTGAPRHRGPRLARPPGGALHGAVPAEAEVDVVGVRADAVVGPPARVHLVGPPDLPVPDDVHDPEAASHRGRTPLRVGREQPRDHRVGDLALVRVVGIEHPVQGPPLGVLRQSRVAVAGDAVVELVVVVGHEPREGGDTRLRLRVADRLRDVRGGDVQTAGEVVVRRGVRDGGASHARGGDGEGECRDEDGTDHAGGT